MEYFQFRLFQTYDSRPNFRSSKIRFEALLRLRQWKLDLTEFASTLKFIEPGLMNHAQC